MILVASHDAGGAEILSSWARRQDQSGLRFWLDGPAVEIFRHKMAIESDENAHRFIRAADLVVCGSSSGSDLEKSAVRVARAARIPSVVWLDHWKHYAERFNVLPDEIWVTDQWAASLAREELPGVKVLVKGNPYMEDVLGEIRLILPTPRAPGEQQRVLYVSEPGREREFQRWLRRTARTKMNLRERPHPSSEFSTARRLAEDVAWADLVVGADSMALAVAIRAGKRTLSVLPPEEPLSIPFPGIERLYPYVPEPPRRTPRPIGQTR